MDQERTPPDLLGLLDLGAALDGGEDRFVGRPPREQTSPVYGGHSAAQALAAAGCTVSGELPVHSVHGFFVRPAMPTVPFDHHVERVRDGASFATRRIRTTQRGREVFSLTASFHRPEPGLDHQDPTPPVPGPESLQTYEERLTKAFGTVTQPLGTPYELRSSGR
ncbi:acyl-CoA thioesterase II [Streptomyces sp. CBMA152]|uniref:acyl-CoA thioesterase n=1 Tax=Streptomyces sp. CBMA152 TaxID=1896312 RepID=UPI001660E0E1|nr:acyl-CoA thioesterase domain-containing protein [Streptomyces sp. CBMA152]MBD0742653.1 hypothetical protein [Streptomyces sp. CBMA152]